jgi:hypothetical protein
MNQLARFVVLLIVCACAPRVHAGDRFVVVPLGELKFTDSAPQPVDGPAIFSRFGWGDVLAIEPYVVLDGPGDAYLEFDGVNMWTPNTGALRRLAVRVDDGRAISGRVFAITPELDGFKAHRFTIESTSTDPAAEANFYAVMEAHYHRLFKRNPPGAAWFRHQLRVARERRAQLAPQGADASPADASGTATDPFDPPTRDRDSLEDSFELFTGARAVAENLDIERALRIAGEEAPTIDVATIQGVNTRALDWKALVKDKKPETDVLAKSIPADQHGIFFPSFDAMVRVFDEADASATPVLQFATVRAEDQGTKERYQTQLCLPLSAIARTLGPTIVASIAITGSDPYLPSGSDIALLFECKQPAVLETYLGMRHGEAKAAGARTVDGTVGGTQYSGVRSDDRRVSSYVARFDETIVVTNSLTQLERIAATRAGFRSALASVDEYVWFRDRYPKSDASESALAVLSDATIRRWASARERIGNSRRVRAAAAMAEIQAASLESLARGKLALGTSAADPAFPMSADFVWTKHGVYSPTYGSLAFLTPVAELSIGLVTESEKRGYEAFRNNFQNLWSNFFDPIALRLSFTDSKVAADLTVMPLAVTTDYREFIDLTRGATLGANSCDTHAETLFHFALAFGPKSELSRMFSSGVGAIGQQFGADPLGWIGNGVAIYADRDAFWDELRGAKDHWDFLGDNAYRLPLALHVEVKDPLKLAVFLTALRALADGSAPGLTKWETKTWHEQGYVKIAPAETGDDRMDKLAVYYAALPDAFVLSLREDLVQRAIDRRLARRSAAKDAVQGTPWLGSSVGLRVERDAVDVLTRLSADEIRNQLQTAAWSAIPILNEWKHRFPEADPVTLHERLWNVRLVSPAGGTFTWNDELQTMESSDYGSPAAPKQGPALPEALERFTRGEFGLSFEADGLRARAELARDSK